MKYKTIEEMQEGIKENKKKREEWIKKNVDSKIIDEIREYNENIDLLNSWINDKELIKMYLYGQMVLKININNNIMIKTWSRYNALDLLDMLDKNLFYDGWEDLEKEIKRIEEKEKIEKYQEGDE